MRLKTAGVHTAIERSTRQNKANGGCTNRPMTLSIKEARFTGVQGGEKRFVSALRDVRFEIQSVEDGFMRLAGGGAGAAVEQLKS